MSGCLFAHQRGEEGVGDVASGRLPGGQGIEPLGDFEIVGQAVRPPLLRACLSFFPAEHLCGFQREWVVP